MFTLTLHSLQLPASNSQLPASSFQLPAQKNNFFKLQKKKVKEVACGIDLCQNPR